MKFSDNTRTILKNFSQINPSLQFKQGTLLRTITDNKSLYAEATIAEEIPRDFAIYDLQQLISVLSMFNDPNIDINESHLFISDDRMELRYGYCDASTIILPPEKNVKLPEKIAELSIDQNHFQQLRKAAATLGVEHCWLSLNEKGARIGVGEGGGHTLEMKPLTGQVFSNVVKSARIAFTVAQLNLIPSGYNITVYGSPKVIAAEWTSTTLPLRYVIPGYHKLSSFEPAS